MQVKGICKNCRYRWRYGAKGNPKHLFCQKDSRVCSVLLQPELLQERGTRSNAVCAYKLQLSVFRGLGMKGK